MAILVAIATLAVAGERVKATSPDATDVPTVAAADDSVPDSPVADAPAANPPQVDLTPALPQDPPLPLERVSFGDESISRLLGWDDQLFGAPGAAGGDRPQLVQAIDHSLEYLRTSAAAEAYATYPVPGITRDRVRRSLRRFRHLLLTSPSAAALQAAVQAEFDAYRSIGTDGDGTVTFTAYFEPTFMASRVPTEDYRYPLYGRPADLDQWPDPHPTRAQLEGVSGLEGSSGPLDGLELVWLRDRLEAFLVHVQGSARLSLTDGTTLSVGYAGRTNYPYTSIGRRLIDTGKVAEADLSLPVVMDYFQQNPAALDDYLPQNDRFIFFKVTAGGPPLGSINQPVTRDRSIATDKTLMPPGALALFHTALPMEPSLQPQPVSRYVLDQDTGGAIQGPGRVDIFMGTGRRAGERAGLTLSDGQLYYLLLKPGQ